MNVYLQCKRFSELSVEELYLLLRLRSEVFIVEQNCSYQDLDNKDQVSYHLLMYIDKDLAGYARLLPGGISYTEVSIGRVITSQHFRGKGYGNILMSKAIEECNRIFGKQKILISAQVYAVPFYKSLGFVLVGEQYMESNIPHVQMILK